MLQLDFLQAFGRPPNSLPTKRFLLSAEVWSTHVATIVNFLWLVEISYDDNNADDMSDYSSDLDSVGGKPSVRLKQNELT